jgi:hypothetical protein
MEGYKFQNKINIGIDMGIHALILFTILTSFFLLYITKLTRQEISNQVGNLIEDSVPKVIQSGKQELGLEFNQLLKMIPYEKLKKEYTGPDEYQELNNSWLKEIILLTNFALFILVTGTIMILSFLCKSDIETLEILKLNLITFSFVGIVEYLFFTNVALKFVPTPPSLMLTSIIDNLRNYF